MFKSIVRILCSPQRLHWHLTLVLISSFYSTSSNADYELTVYNQVDGYASFENKDRSYHSGNFPYAQSRKLQVKTGPGGPGIYLSVAWWGGPYLWDTVYQPLPIEMDKATNNGLYYSCVDRVDLWVKGYLFRNQLELEMWVTPCGQSSVKSSYHYVVDFFKI